MNTPLMPTYASPRRVVLAAVAGFSVILAAGFVSGPAAATSFTNEAIYAPSGVYNSVATDGFGFVHMATYDPFSGDLIYVARSDIGPPVTETVASAGNVGQYCSLALDPTTGVPHISYYDATLGQLWLASRTGGVWTTEPVDTNPVNVGHFTSLAFDASGRPHISYNDAADTQIYYAVKSGGAWIRQAIDPGTDSEIRVDVFGRPHFVYTSVSGPNTLIRYAVISGATTSFSTIDSIPTTSALSGLPSLSVDVSGNPNVSYTRECALYYARSAPNGTWSTSLVDANGITRASSIVLDSDGDPRIAYQVDVTGVCGGIVGFAMDLRFAEMTRGYWVRTLAASGGGIITGTEPDLALTPVGDPVIAYGSSLPQLVLATGSLVNARYLVPNTIRPVGPANIRVYGSSVVNAPFQVAQLQQGSTVLNATGFAAVLGGDNVQMDFDFTAAPTGVYSLILVNSAGADTIDGAMVVYDEAVDLTRLTTHTSPEITPMISNPGTAPRLLFASGREGGQELFVRPLPAASDLSAYRVTFSAFGGGAQFPSWSPDGSRIVYHDIASDQLLITELSTGYTQAPFPLPTGGTARAPAWNPAGNEIAYDDGTALSMIDAGTNGVTPLFGAVGATVIDPDWSPDGLSLAYTYDDPLVPGRGIQAARVLPSPLGPGDFLIPEDGSENFGAQWSPDGKWIAFTSDRAGGEDFGVYAVDTRGFGWILPITQSAGNEGQVTWGQDGTTLSFVGTYGGVQDVFQASNLPTQGDADGDAVPDVVDDCPQPPLLGTFDRDADGCADPGSGFRFTRYWGMGRFPIAWETPGVGDPDIQNGSEFTVLAGAFATWAAAGPDEVTFSQTPPGFGMENAVSGDGRNSISFTDSDGFISGTVAITFSTVAVQDTFLNGRLFMPGEIVDSDILFNTLHYDFSTPTAPGPTGAFDLGSVATHEIGHLLGVGHSSILNSTMFYVAFRGPEQQTLEPDDSDLIPTVYHGAGPSPALTLAGNVVRGEDGESPVVGAAVLAISDVGDTVKMAVTGEDGSFAFYGLPPVRLFVTPLDGSPSVNGLKAAGVTPLLSGVADLDFQEEFYDGPAETNSDYGLTGVLLSAYPINDVQIITNPDLSGPAVVSTFPGDSDADIAATTAITVTFDEVIEINSVPGNLILTNQTTSAAVGGNAAFLTPSNVLVFTPSAPLDYSTDYVLDIGPGITDRSGNPMSGTVTVQFTTQAPPPVAILGASPAAVPVGGSLVLSGTGFSPIPGDNQVDFQGATTQPYAATLEALYITVPAGATSGDVTVTVGAETSNAFTVSIIPPQAPPVGVSLGDAPLAGDPRKLTVVPDGTWAYVATSAGVTAVAALPTAGGFLDHTDISLGGGSLGVTSHPDGRRVFAVSSNPPYLNLINSDPGSGALFNTVELSIPLPAEPLGIEMIPGGAHVLVSYAGRVAAYSVISGPGFGQEIREWTQSGVGFLGDLGVASDGAEAYAATTGGEIAVLGLGAGEGIVTLLPAGTTPRESAGSVLGNAFFVVDESGMLRRFAERGPLEGSLTVGGGYRGLAVSPDGSFAYALNYTLNRVDVVDATTLLPTLVSDFATGIDPVDIGVGSTGRYLYVAADDENVLEVYDSQSGVLLNSVSPSSGGFGVVLTLAGSGFDPVASGNQVTIGGNSVTVTGVNASGTALTVELLNVNPTGAVQVTTGGQISNTLPFKFVNKDYNPFAYLGVVNELEIAEVQRYLESPDGRWLIGCRNDGSMVVIQADPSQPGFLRPVQELSAAQTGLIVPGQMAMTPDGDKLYVADIEVREVRVFEVTGSATTPLEPAGVVRGAGGAAASLGGQLLAMTPDGKRLLVTSFSDEAVFEVATTNDSALTESGVGSPIGGFTAFPAGLAVDPRGNLLYVGDDIGVPHVRVFDLDPDSPTYRQEMGLWSLDAAASQGPTQLAVSPRGDFLYCVVAEPLALNLEYRAAVVDIDATSATYGQVLTAPAIGLDAAPFLLPNRSGRTVFVLEQEIGGQFAAYTGDGTMSSPFSGPFSARLGVADDFVLSRDEARIYAPSGGGGLILVDVSGVSTYQVVSGDNQTGVVDQELPFPFVVRATDFNGDAAEGTPVRLSALTGNFGFPIGDATTVADAQGYVRVDYTAGPTPGQDTADLTSGAGTLQFFVDILGDPSLLPPTLLDVTPGPSDLPGITTNVAADFSKEIDASSVAGNVTLQVAGGGPTVATQIAFANAGERVTLDPVAALSPSTAYEVVVGSGIVDLAANPLTNPGTFTFTTGAALPLVLDAVQQSAARSGTVVVLSGTGFSETPSENSVIFTGAGPLTPFAADPGALSVYVPSSAVTGTVHVEVGGTASNALPFTVLGLIVPVNEVVNVVDVPTSGQAIAILPNGTRAYMTSPSANTVVPIRLSDGVPETAIAVGLYPFAVAPHPGSSLVYVSNFQSNTISVIGTDPSVFGFHTVLNTINAGANPAGLVVSPDGRTLYVCNYGDGTLDFIDIDPNSGTFNSAQASISTGSGSKSVTVTPDGAIVIVGTGSAILLISASDGSAQASISTGSGSKSVTVTPDGAFAVALLEDGELLLISLAPGIPDEDRAQASISTGSGSKSVTVSPDGARVYVTQSDGFVLVYEIVELGAGGAAAEPLTSLYAFRFAGAIEVGENPEGLAFDLVTQTLLVVNSGDNTITFINASETPVGPFEVLTDVDPNTLNPKSKGKYITAALQFPTFLDPMGVDLASVELDSTIAADTTQSALTDKNGDGILELEVKFLRQAVIALYPDQDTVEVHVTGLIDGRPFSGQDTILLLRPRITGPHAGSIVAQESSLEIRWDSMPSGVSDHMDLHWSRDRGVTWDTITEGTEDDGAYSWTVPDVPSSRDCLIMLVARDGLGGVEGIDIMLQPFTVSDTPTGIEDRLPIRFALLPAAPNPFAAGTNIRFELPEPAAVTLRIHGVDGSVVRTLASESLFPAGRHAVAWDGRTERGVTASTGVYFLKIVAGKREAVQKIVRVTR